MIYRRPPSVPSCTSEEAALSIEPSTETLRGLVLKFFRDRGAEGATRAEIEAGTGLIGNTVRPRVRELIKGKKIIETTRTRPTASGRQAFVLVAIPDWPS